MSANEQWKGQRLGTAQSFRRVFLVEDPTDANSVTCDPRFDSELLTAAALGTSLVGLPWAMAQLPNIVSSIDSTTFIVEVPYESPSGTYGSGVGSEGWQVRISGGLDTVRTDTERRTLDEIEENKPPRVVGPFAYIRGEGRADVTYTPGGDPWGEYRVGESPGTKLVFDRKQGKRIIVGMDMFVPNASITFRRLCGDNNPTRVNEVLYRLGYVNDDEVRLPGLGGYHFMPGQLLLQSFEASEVPGNDANNPFVHDFSVTFAGNSEGWQFDYFHTWTDPDVMGAAAAVVIHDNPNFTDPDDPWELYNMPVHELFRRQFEAPFNGWLESLQ